MSKLKVVEICAGAGGQSLGLHKAGFEHELAVELDEMAAETLTCNLSRLQKGVPDVRVGDVADRTCWNPADSALHGIDLFAGGVPCPPFSLAGKQLGSADERDLFAWAVETVGVMRPKAVLLENVRGLAAARFAGYRQAVADQLSEFGYWSEWKLLHASNHDVPQLRPRFVLVALQPAEAAYFRWPAEIPTRKRVGTALRSIMLNGSGEGDRPAPELVKRWVERANRIAPTIVGGSKKHGGADLGPTRAKRAWLELGVDAKGIADLSPGADWLGHELEPPRLTLEMVERLQGFNGPGFRWDFKGRKTSRYRQIGNAFPPPVAKAVGDSLRDALLHIGESQPVQHGTVHDDIYRLLKNASAPLTIQSIVEKLGVDKADVRNVLARLEALQQDFVVEELETERGLAYGLGEFKAFRGQEVHSRHTYFANRRTRARVS